MLLAALLAWASGASANDFWDSLWHNADQRGEQLMREGNAAAAARTYADPQHKAYAELQAGDYQRAAQDFSAFNDSTSNYNRGNALAHAGQLQEAIKAYDAALARDPKNEDAATTATW
jgi:Tetratricopeptide repeat.